MSDSPILLVEASAGSGKTYYLTRDYLASLFETVAALRGGEVACRQALRSILAITFTRKAAGEMGERIRDGLISLAWDHPSGDRADRLRDLRDRGLCGQDSFLIREAGILVETLLRHLDDFQVRTIDSFMSAMVQVLSPELGLPPLMETVEDQKGTIRARMLSFLEQMARRNWERLEPALLLLEAQGQVVGRTPEEVLVGRLSNLFSRRLTRELPPRTVGGTPSTERGGEAGWQDLWREVGRGARELGLCLRELQTLPGNPSNGNRLTPKRLDLLARAAEIQPRQLMALWAEVSWLNPRLGGELEGLAKSRALERPDVQEVLGRARLLRQELWEALAELALGISRQELAPYLDLLADFESFWSGEREILLIAELPLLLGRWVQEWEASLAFPHLFFKLSERYRRMLVDEFQDTSQSQFHILCPLAAEPLSSQPDARFLAVGDRKQAIYRWRGGDSGLMHAPNLEKAFNDSGAPFPVSVQPLPGNWRSREEVVAWNNEFWSRIHELPALGPVLSERVRDHFRGGGQEIPESRADRARGGRVELARIDTTGLRAKDDWWPVFLEQVEGRLQAFLDAGYGHSDIAVLVRSNADAQALMGDLLGRGWHFSSDHSFRISSSPLVSDLIAFLRWTHQPGDAVSLLSVLLSPYFTALWERGRDGLWPVLKRDPWRWLAEIADQGLGLRQGVLEALPGVGETWLTAWFRSADAEPAYDLVCDLLGLLGMEEQEAWLGELPFVLAFQEMVHQEEEEGRSDLGSLLARWEEMLSRPELMPQVAPREEGGGRVRMLTLHKSKGLEFPAVLLPILPSRPPRSWEDGLLEDGSGELCWVGRGQGAFHPHLSQLELEEAHREVMDDLNLLYVGMTRSRDALTLVVAGGDRTGGGEGGSLVSLPRERILLDHPLWEDGLVRGVWPEQTSPPAPAPPSTGQPSCWKVRCLRTRQWRHRMLVYREPDLSSPAPARLRGVEIHRLLALLDEPLDKGGLERLREGWKRLGLAPEGWLHLESLLGEPQVRHLFAPPPGVRILNEHPHLEGGCDDDDVGRHVPDRLLLGEGFWALVEYKTGVWHPAHEEQVQRYQEMLGRQFPTWRGESWLLYLDPQGPGWVRVPW